MNRQAGETTNHLLNIPNQSVFVWVSSVLHYPRALLKYIGRTDIRIVSPHWLINSWEGARYSDIILDHACILNNQQEKGLHRALGRCLRDGYV